MVRRLGSVFGAVCLLLSGCGGPETPYQASQGAAALDPQVNWANARLVVVQDAGRYKTLDSFAREAFAAMTGREHLPGLSPVASLFEWLFNRQAYLDTPLIRVKEIGVRARLTAHLSEDKRQRILTDPYFTPNEIADPSVNRALSSLETERQARRSAGRVRTAQTLAAELEHFVNIVPQPGGSYVDPWFTPVQAMANLSDEQLAAWGLTRADLPAEAQRPVPEITPEQALAITAGWSSLRAAWLRGDAPGVQTNLDQLCSLLPALAESGVYLGPSQQRAELRYYAFGKFTWGWLLYFTAFPLSVWALVTRWKLPWRITMGFLGAALACHLYGLALRWYIIGHIPLANMFEALVGSAAMAIALVLLLELIYKTRILLVAVSVVGCVLLVLAGYILPAAGLSTADVTPMMGILDHLQLRIHTLLITGSYALICVAAIVGLIYLIGYYSERMRSRVPQGVRGFPVQLAAGAPEAPLRLLGRATRRPILAGASPGDDVQTTALPQWLNDIDWCHLIILNLVFVMLFVGGVIMGAMWADQSWGRPWGWDPKEVFALNTWIIYAILLHVRYVVRSRGLWTAWLSLAGCAMMAFNWFFVNFYINSIHSYA